jgi:ABC-type dipeptide/oligopeptide/nickel transport system ATPase component
MTNNLLEVSHLKTSFATEGGHITAVDDVSFSMKRGEVLGIVGESGCGKSVTAFSIMRLFNDGGTSVEGAIHFNNKNLIELSEKELEQIRGSQISMIFQDPMSSLNPVFTIGDQIMEPLIIHQKMNRKEARVKALEMLKLVGIAAPETRFNEYPYQLSGGMRQRVMIAISLSCNPQLLIADEPTTALDVTIQAQILDLMMHLKKRLDMGIIMITHDLGVVA